MTPLGNKTFIATPNGNYATWLKGKGPLVVLLHGWPVTSYHWRYLVPFLETAGYETLCIDLKGLGESSASDASFEKEQLAKEVWGVIHQIKPQNKKTAIVGHDWGGSVAIAMAALKSDSVTHLIIEDEIPPGIEAPLRGESLQYYSTWHGAFHRTPIFSEAMIDGKEETYVNFFLNLRFDPESLSKKDRDHYLDQYRTAKKTRAALAYYRTPASDGVFFRLLEKKPLEMPALALNGVRGMGPAVLDALRRMVPTAIGLTFEKSGHYPAEEEPQKFNQEIVDFLKKS